MALLGRVIESLRLIRKLAEEARRQRGGGLPPQPGRFDTGDADGRPPKATAAVAPDPSRTRLVPRARSPAAPPSRPWGPPADTTDRSPVPSPRVSTPRPRKSPHPSLSKRIRARLREPQSLRDALVLKEILDRPRGRQRQR